MGTIELLTLNGYARHRKERGLPGASLASVQQAIRGERIQTIRDAKGRIRIDPTAADKAWLSNTDVFQQQRGNGRRLSKRQSGRLDRGLGDEQRRLVREQADKLALQNAQKRRELVPVVFLTEAAARAAKQVGAVLDTIPAALKRRLPDVDDAVIAVVREDVTRARNIASECRFELEDEEDGKKE